MKKKIGVAVGIFLLLFSGSWFLNEAQSQPELETRTTDPQSGLLNISNMNMKSYDSPPEEETSSRFMPREYIKIKQR